MRANPSRLWMLHGLIDPRDLDRAQALLADDAPVAAAKAGALVAVASAPPELEGAGLAALSGAGASEANAAAAAPLAQRHHRVLCRLAARIDALPLRFGAFAADPSRLSEPLAEPGPVALARAFDALRGRVEAHLTVRLEPRAAAPTRAPAAAADGRSYLQARAEARRSVAAARTGRADLVRRLRAEFSGLAQAVSETRPADAAVLLDLRGLIARSDLDALAEAAADWAEAGAAMGVASKVVGPLPPFAFAEAAMRPAEARA